MCCFDFCKWDLDVLLELIIITTGTLSPIIVEVENGCKQITLLLGGPMFHSP